MALFKIFGNFASGNTTLPTSTTQGYCYFDKNTGKFYIDTATSETAELGTNRLALNADKADKDGAGNNITDTYLTKVNGLTDVTFNTNNSIIYKTINGTTSPIVQIPILAGSGNKSAYGGGAIEPSKVNAFAFGLQAQADGVNSIALGAGANTNSMHSISIGCRSSTTGVRSIAIGYAASTSSADAIAIGSGTLANSTKQMALGCYNIADTSSTYCLIVGNGTSDDARSNALTVDWNGNTTIAGSLTTSNIYLSGITNISNNGIDADPAFISWNDNYLKLRFNDEESNSIELGNNGLIINDGTGVGNNGQALLSDGTKAYWGTPAATVTESTISGWGFTKNAGTITGATANGGLTVTGSTLGHSNAAITAKTTAGVYPVKIDTLGHITEAGTAIVSSAATSGGTTLSLVTTGEKYIWNNKSSVSITPILTSGTKIGTITIDGTSTDLYSETNTDTKVTQNAVITTAGEYPVILANSTTTTTITDSVNKTSTLTYNPNTQILTSPKVSADNIYVGTASYGDTLPTTGTTGQIFFVEDNEEQGETVTTTDISNWNNKSTVSITPNLTSGTKIGTITIDGTNTDLYCQTNTDTKTRQTLYSNNDNLPLLMSYQTASDTTTDVDNITYRNNSIYANPSTGTITTPNETITNKLTINTLVGNSATYGDTLPATGVEGQIFFKKLSSS